MRKKLIGVFEKKIVYSNMKCKSEVFLIERLRWACNDAVAIETQN